MAVDIGFKLKHRSKDKLADYQDGTCYLTSHRIIYVDNAKPRERAAQIELSLVKDIESYVNIWYQGFIGTLLWRAIVQGRFFASLAKTHYLLGRTSCSTENSILGKFTCHFNLGVCYLFIF